VETATGDLLHPADVDEAFDGISVAYHVAARIGFESGIRAQVQLDTNVSGTAIVVNAALRAGVTRLVHTSSIAALGPRMPDASCRDERSPWVETGSETRYAVSKHRAETEVYRAVAEGLDAVIVNPALIFGTGRSGENTRQIVDRIRDGQMRRYPSGATSVVDVLDVAQGLRLAMDRGQTGSRYILAAESLSWQQILSELATALGVPPPASEISGRMLEWVARLTELSSKVTGVPASLTLDAARQAGTRQCHDASLARSELGWTPRPFAETSRRIAADLGAEST
jgi:dihydroflavonol-4-reductase